MSEATITMILIALAILLGFVLLKILSPAAHIRFHSYERQIYVAATRRMEMKRIVNDYAYVCKDGQSTFYVVIDTHGNLKHIPITAVEIINPILREDNPDEMLIRVTVKVVSGKIVKVEQVSMTDAKVTLRWDQV